MSQQHARPNTTGITNSMSYQAQKNAITKIRNFFDSRILTDAEVTHLLVTIGVSKNERKEHLRKWDGQRIAREMRE